MSVEGRIRDIDRERNGFVIRLDRGGAVFFADRHVDVRGDRRGRGVRELDRGDVVRLRGYQRSRGVVEVRSIDLLRDDDRRGSGILGSTISGVVESADLRDGRLWIRDERSGRVLEVRVDRRDFRDRDLQELRRGDRVTVRGSWRGGRFEAEDIDIRNRRW